MSKISSQEVKHIAKLARLGLKDKEIKKMQEELTSILNYIDQLKEVNIEKIELQEKEMFNRTREDKSLSYSGIDKLIELFPDKKNRHLKVKSVFQKE